MEIQRQDIDIVNLLSGWNKQPEAIEPANYFVSKKPF